MSKKLVIMRGLPWCGKSYTAKEIAGDVGVVYSTDDYFYTMVDPWNPTEYNFVPRYLAYAHKWNFMRATFDINVGHPLVIIDNTNTTASEPKKYVEYALCQDYEIEIREPTSDRWKEIRELLQRKKECKKELRAWAAKLAEGSLQTHKVPQFAIEKMMWRWQNDLTLDQILEAEDYDSGQKKEKESPFGL